MTNFEVVGKALKNGAPLYMLFIFIWQLTRIPFETLLWVGPSRSQDPACLTLVLLSFIPFSGKAPGRWSEYAASEAAWITAIKQEQGSFQANIPPKEPRPKSRAAAKAERKEPRHGVGPRAASKTLQKVIGAN